jgi:hypothetical protein
MRRFKVWLACKLLGRPESVEREVEYAYANIWPKHEAYEKQNKIVLREVFLRIAKHEQGKGEI